MKAEELTLAELVDLSGRAVRSARATAGAAFVGRAGAAPQGPGGDGGGGPGAARVHAVRQFLGARGRRSDEADLPLGQPGRLAAGRAAHADAAGHRARHRQDAGGAGGARPVPDGSHLARLGRGRGAAHGAGAGRPSRCAGRWWVTRAATRRSVRVRRSSSSSGNVAARGIASVRRWARTGRPGVRRSSPTSRIFTPRTFTAKSCG